ncbi:MAG: hypothetical protein PHX04_00395 [Bacilli bacterium]|nr:hypothetical protein [Bacilli bacterium]
MIDIIMIGDYERYIRDFSYSPRDIEYITDTIKEMSWWHCFNQDRK